MSHSKKLRIIILVEKGMTPPADVTGVDLQAVEWVVEYDVITTLKKEGHDVLVLEVENDLLEIHRIVDHWKPHIAFNLLEGFGGVSIFDQNVVSYLELLNVPYTGCNPRGLMVARNKSLAKKVLGYHGISTPRFEVLPKTRKVERPKDMTFPLFIKPITEEGSSGISDASIVYDDAKFIEQIKYVHEKVGAAAMVENYIEGRELYVGVLGNSRMEVMPVWELFFPEKSDVKIATEKVKFDPVFRKLQGIDSGPAGDLPKDVAVRAQEMAKNACRVLGLNGYARMDFRLTAEGKLYVLEANPNPHIGRLEDFAKSAEKAGMSYPDLLWRILSLGMRWQPEESAPSV